VSKDCGLHEKKNINLIFLFACLVDWFDSSQVDILKNQGTIVKNCLGWCEYQHACAIGRAIARALTRAPILSPNNQSTNHGKL